jgi:hypothetical protein
VGLSVGDVLGPTDAVLVGVGVIFGVGVGVFVGLDVGLLVGSGVTVVD